MRLDRPIGIFLLLWPALWALLIAGEGRPDPMVLMVFILGVAFLTTFVSRQSTAWLAQGYGIEFHLEYDIDIKLQEIRDKVALARPLLPLDVEFRDELPKTNVGKILRRELRDEELKKTGS